MKNFTRLELICIQCQYEAVDRQTYCRNICVKTIIEHNIGEDGHCVIGKSVYDKLKQYNKNV